MMVCRTLIAGGEVAGVTAKLLADLMAMRDAGDMTPFYARDAWKRMAREVRKLDRYECIKCKARGRYSRGVIVHHVKHLEDRPDLALSITDPETGERQLITLCKACHEAEHPDALRCSTPATPLTIERWD